MGKKLFQFTIKEAQKRGNKIVKLYTSPRNKLANKMYDKLGFKLTETIKERNTDEIAWHKELKL